MKTVRDRMVQDLMDEMQELIRAMQDGSYEEEIVARTLCEEALSALLGEEG
jgi:hypothetical protein